MRLRSVLAAGLAAACIAGPARAQLELPRVSPKSSVTQTIGLTEVTVAYSRPGVKGRTIWGDLVPFDKPWRTGANEATVLTVSDEVQFGGQKLPAGSYALLTIPGKDGWQVVLNSDKDMWGANGYQESKDVLRVKVAPAAAAEAAEWMQFTFENLTATSGELVLRWEKTRVAVPITVDVNAKALANARAAMASAKADDWRTPYQAAGYCFNNDVALDEGQQWLEKSVAIQGTFPNLWLLARWQHKQGKKAEAIKTAGKAIAAGKAAKPPMDVSAAEKQLAEWSGKKS